MHPQPFVFWKAAFLVEVTPFKATSLSQLLTGVTLAPPTSIFYHLHQRFFRNPDQLPAYPNDFAEWADTVLGDAVVAERLANLNLFRSLEVDLATIRREISVILAEHLQQSEESRSVSPESAFIFCDLRHILFPSGQQARVPAEMLEILRHIDSDVIGYHLFAPELVREPVVNDFATWFRQWGYESLAQQLDAFDPYLNSLEDNRAYLIELIETGIQQENVGGKND
ncbi:MAG: hypothetical protein D6736_05755 [Nitrospinota bacterium]|nr:MAG: hypothetical protein D6736_05755 [Nitrospinota bacterium]